MRFYDIMVVVDIDYISHLPSKAARTVAKGLQNNFNLYGIT